jgi:hypothetical protein
MGALKRAGDRGSGIARGAGDSVLATGPGTPAAREQQVPMARHRVPAAGGWNAPGAPPQGACTTLSTIIQDAVARD